MRWGTSEQLPLRSAARQQPSRLTNLPPGLILPGASGTFSGNAWSRVLEYGLQVGRMAGGMDLYNHSEGKSLSRQVRTLPADGRGINVRLWSRLASGWRSTDYTYTAARQWRTTLSSWAAPRVY